MARRILMIDDEENIRRVTRLTLEAAGYEVGESGDGERGLERIPIMALSANVLTHQIQEYRSAGMDGSIAKPVQAASLYAAITEAVYSPPIGNAPLP